MDGFYKQLSDYIKSAREESENGGSVIKAEELADKLDLSQISREELEGKCARAMASVALYTNGYRSVIRGMGYFFDIKNFSNPYFLQKIKENAKLSAMEKEHVARFIEILAKKKISELPDYVQYSLDFDEDGNSKIIEDMSQDQFVSMLEEIAKKTVI